MRSTLMRKRLALFHCAAICIRHKARKGPLSRYRRLPLPYYIRRKCQGALAKDIIIDKQNFF
jgi:hypothetical protein